MVYCTISNGSTIRVKRDTRILPDIFDRTSGDRGFWPKFAHKFPKSLRATALGDPGDLSAWLVVSTSLLVRRYHDRLTLRSSLLSSSSMTIVL